MRQRKAILFLLISVYLFSVPSWVNAGQLGDWTTLNYLNVGRFANIGILAYDTIIYTLGGFVYNTTPYPVEKAVMNPDGTLSDWSIDSQNMKIARSGPVGFYYNGYIYAFGGSDGVNYVGQCTTAERAKVNPEGILGEWQYINPLLKGLKQASLVLSPPYVYIIGGWSATDEYNTEVFRSRIQNDGSLSSWSLLTSKLFTGRNQASTILIDSTIYVVGGYSHVNSETINIESAVICPDGELGAFQYNGVTKTYHHLPGLFYDGKYLNIIGGYSGGGYLDYCEERVQVNTDGSLGYPEPLPALQYETSGFGYVQASTGGYIIGGDCTDVQFAPFLLPTSIDKKYWEVLEGNER